MDLALPRLDGWEATRRLNAYPLTRHIPVVAVTTHISQADCARATAAGCVAVIAKPFAIDLLLSTLAGVLAQAPPSRQRTVGTDLEA
jgi:CheY-like chemotaxis protein